MMVQGNGSGKNEENFGLGVPSQTSGLFKVSKLNNLIFSIFRGRGLFWRVSWYFMSIYFGQWCGEL